MLPIYMPLASISKVFSFENIIRILTHNKERISREKLQTVYFERLFFKIESNALLEEVFSDINSYAFLTSPLRKSGEKYYYSCPNQIQLILYYLSLNPDAITEFFRKTNLFLQEVSTTDEVRAFLLKFNHEFVKQQARKVSDNDCFQIYWDYYLKMLDCYAFSRAIGMLILFSVLNIDSYYLLNKFRDDVIFSQTSTQQIETTASYVLQSALNSEMFLGIQNQQNMNDTNADILCTIGRGELNKHYSCFSFEPISHKNNDIKTDVSDNMENAKPHDKSAYSILSVLGSMEEIIRMAVQANSYDETNSGLYYIKVNGQYLQLANWLLHTQVILGEKNQNSKWKVIFHDGWISIKPVADTPLNVFALDVPNGRRLPGTALWLFFKHDTLSQHFKLYKVINK